MANRLLPDLQDLVEDGIITPEIAGNIKIWYDQKKEPGSNRFVLVLGVFGSLLVGLGIVLLVAHNWDQLNRLTKTIFSFLPLLIAQLVCLFALLRKKDNIVWSESSAVFLFFAIGATLSLISQVYHIGGSLSSFLLTWLLLSFLLIHIMPSSMVSLLYIGINTWYGVEVGYSGIFSSSATESPFLYLLLLALVAPHYYHLWKNRKESNFFHIHNWVITISLALMLGTFIGNQYPFLEWSFIGYLSLFAIYYGIGASESFVERKTMMNPFLILGMVGIIVVLVVWSFDYPWKELAINHSDRSHFFSWRFSFITIALLIVNGLLAFIIQRRKALINISPVEFSPFLLVVMVLSLSGLSNFGQLIINGWILLIGLYFVRKGSKKNHLGVLNFGLVIILLLAIIRFFDDSIPFIWRGVFFLATGAGFFIANYWMLKKRKQAPLKNIPS